MELLRKIKWNELKHEYGLDGKRLLPWEGAQFPYGGAYCVVRSGTASASHINEPLGEEELFIAIAGKGKVWIGETAYEMQQGDTLFIPAGTMHHIENVYEEDFHLYALWWDTTSAENYIKTVAKNG